MPVSKWLKNALDWKIIFSGLVFFGLFNLGMFLIGLLKGVCLCH